MKSSIPTGALIVTTALLAIFVGQPAFAANNDDAEIRAAIKHFDAAFNARKTEEFLALYTAEANAIYFEEALPLQIRGRDNFRKYVDSAFTETAQLQQETTVEKLIADGNIAAAVCIVQASWTDTTGKHSQFGRFTMVFKKVNGKWLIWHEHYSLPYDEATGKAVFDARP